jgi:hypothetical protein
LSVHDKDLINNEGSQSLGDLRCDYQEERLMPIHFNDLDLIPKVSGLKSALIVPCIMCPAVTVAIREEKPLMKLFRNLFKSAPFEQYLKTLRIRLQERGVKTDVFNSRMYHHWFLCMWSAGRREKLRQSAKDYEAVIVLGCNSATETVRDAVQSAGCRVIEGMEVGGLTNAKLKVHLPANVSFEDVKIVPMPRQESKPSLVD